MARLPQITGFVLGGVLVGPFGLNLLRAEGLPSLAVVRPPAWPCNAFPPELPVAPSTTAPIATEREAGPTLLSLEVVLLRCNPLPHYPPGKEH